MTFTARAFRSAFHDFRNSRLPSLAAIAVAAQVVLACASTGSSHGTLNGRPSGNSSAALGIVEVTRGDLSAASTGSSLYSALSYLRPGLLQSRRETGGVPRPIIDVVYVNGVRAGDVETLMSIPISRVRKVEFLPVDERRPYGFRYEPGAILVTLTMDRP